jgi:hypothetical protein
MLGFKHGADYSTRQIRASCGVNVISGAPTIKAVALAPPERSSCYLGVRREDPLHYGFGSSLRLSRC